MHVVDTERELSELVGALASEPALYLDTEFDSTRDGKTLCLVQLSGRATVHLVDALRIATLDALRRLANPEREWVLHAGLQDVELLEERLGLARLPRVFDTQVAWALSSAEASVSLSYLKFKLLGTRSGKAHQADDWRRRPLPASQLAYAVADVSDLPALHDRLAERLDRLGRREIVYAASSEACAPVREAPEPLALEAFRNAWQLDPPSQAGLRHLVAWYNALAPNERGDAPDPKTLFSIASRLPRSRDDLARIKGVSRRFANQHGGDLVAALARATAAARSDDFVPIDPPPYATFDEIRADGWLALARAEISAELEIAPELAFPARVVRRMRALVGERGDRARAVEALDGWRRELLAEPLTRFASRA